MDKTEIIRDWIIPTLINEQKEIAGLWNGKESGQQEDDAQKALDIIEVSKQLLELLED